MGILLADYRRTGDGQRRAWFERSVGQFRAAHGCPICEAKDNGNWTCRDCTVLVDVHRNLIRNLQQWRVLYEAQEVPDFLLAPNGREYSLWDVTRFYEHRVELPERMSQSIQYCLFDNMKEKEAAVRMGIKPTNPVSVYATIGLTTLLGRAALGTLSGYFVELEAPTGVLLLQDRAG